MKLSREHKGKFSLPQNRFFLVAHCSFLLLLFWKDYCVTRQKLLQGRLGQALLPWKILNLLSSIVRDIKSLIRSEH